MFRYTGKYCLMGLMNRYGKLFDNGKGYQANRNHAVSIDPDFYPNYPKVSYYYIDNKPKDHKSYKNTQLVSKFDDEFFELRGKKYKEIRETRNKFDKVITMREYNQEHVLGLIDLWDSQSGGKYGWQRRSGRDRSFFNRFYEPEKDNLFSRFYYIGDKIVGYAVLHRDDQNCYEYLVRKTNNLMRNICLYVDYKTFEEIYAIEQQSFYSNWGASSGKLLKYKRKFGIYEEKSVYFYKIAKSS